MSAALDQRLERAILAAERAGKVVEEATIGPDGIRLRFAGQASAGTTPEDLIDWRPRKRRG